MGPPASVTLTPQMLAWVLLGLMTIPVGIGPMASRIITLFQCRLMLVYFRKTGVCEHKSAGSPDQKPTSFVMPWDDCLLFRSALKLVPREDLGIDLSQVDITHCVPFEFVFIVVVHLVTHPLNHDRIKPAHHCFLLYERCQERRTVFGRCRESSYLCHLFIRQRLVRRP